MEWVAGLGQAVHRRLRPVRFVEVEAVDAVRAARVQQVLVDVALDLRVRARDGGPVGRRGAIAVDLLRLHEAEDLAAV